MPTSLPPEPKFSSPRALLNNLRDFYRAWTQLRDARYQHLAAILDAPPVADDKRDAECACTCNQ